MNIRRSTLQQIRADAVVVATSTVPVFTRPPYLFKDGRVRGEHIASAAVQAREYALLHPATGEQALLEVAYSAMELGMQDAHVEGHSYPPALFARENGLVSAWLIGYALVARSASLPPASLQ